MPRKAKGNSNRVPVPSPFTVYRDKRGHFVSASKKRGVHKTQIYTQRGPGGRFVSPIREFLRYEHPNITDRELDRIAKHRTLAKRLRIAWDTYDFDRTVTPGKRKIIYRGRSYYKKEWRALREKRMTQIKIDYYMEVLGVSRKDARKLLKYILSGGKGDLIMDQMRKRVGSPPRKRQK